MLLAIIGIALCIANIFLDLEINILHIAVAFLICCIVISLISFIKDRKRYKCQ